MSLHSTTSFLHETKKSLDKLLQETQIDPVYIMDILNDIALTNMTTELIKDSKLGKTIASIIEKFDEGSEVKQKAKDILTLWKKIIASKGSSESKTTKPNIAKSEKNEKGKLKSKSDIDVDSKLIQNIHSIDVPDTSVLSLTRRKIYQIFASTFKISTNQKDAESIAAKIEKSLDEHFPCDDAKTNKAYKAKAQSLTFNLKQSEV
jgi:hypothetical protein